MAPKLVPIIGRNTNLSVCLRNVGRSSSNLAFSRIAFFESAAIGARSCPDGRHTTLLSVPVNYTVCSVSLLRSLQTSPNTGAPPGLWANSCLSDGRAVAGGIRVDTGTLERVLTGVRTALLQLIQATRAAFDATAKRLTQCWPNAGTLWLNEGVSRQRHAHQVTSTRCSVCSGWSCERPRLRTAAERATRLEHQWRSRHEPCATEESAARKARA